MSTTQQTQIYSSATDRMFATTENILVEVRNKPLLLAQDSIDVSSVGKKQSQGIELAPKLPAPHLDPKDPHVDPNNALEDFTKAFCAAFTSIANDTNSQTQMLNQLQALDQTQSKIVVTASNEAIAAEEVATNLEGQIADQEAEAAKMQEDLGWMSYLGIAMTVIAIVLSIPTGGASDEIAAAADADEGIELSGSSTGADGATSLKGLQAEAQTVAAKTTETVEDASAEAEDASSASKNNTAKDSASTKDNLAKKTNTAKDSSETKESLAKKEKQEAIKRKADEIRLKRYGRNCGDGTFWGDMKGFFGRRYADVKWFNSLRADGEVARDSVYMKMFSFVGSSCSVIPMALDGATKIKISESQFALAGVQKNVAPLLGLVNENQLNFQFYQQLNRRQSTVVQTEGEQLSDILTLAGSVMKGYQQIPSQLVNPA